MKKILDTSTCPSLALWGGLEATVNRVGDQYFSQMEQNGHEQRISDLDRFAALGITSLRYPVLWELIAPDGLAHANWSWPDERLNALRELCITPIVGLVHHGSGPPTTCLTDPSFAPQLAAYAGAVARRYPWLDYYTPVNEPCTTARFSGLYGLWYPHEQSDRSFVRALLNQCLGIALSMQAIRAVNPNAKLVQTDDLGKTYGTPPLAERVNFYNERRWLTWDLLCGAIAPGHALWNYLTANGATVGELMWFCDHPCPPDIIGVNYYITSDRWLDHRREHHDAREFCDDGYVDIVAARVVAPPLSGVGPLLEEAWQRYRLPLAVTEAHIDAKRENHLRWLSEIWNAALHAQQRGVDVRAVAVWSLLGSYDWNSLVTERKGYYETGAYDLRGPVPRPTALATLMQELATGRQPSNPVLQGLGWWRCTERLVCPPVVLDGPMDWIDHPSPPGQAQPLLIVGGNEALCSAFALVCGQRGLAHHAPTGQEIDVTDALSIDAAIRRYHPWAIVHTGGQMDVYLAEQDVDICHRENIRGPVQLAAACARHDIALLSFSSDQVFDGVKNDLYVESDDVAPLSNFGRSKAEAERRVLSIQPTALIIRCSALFGPWDKYDFVARALRAIVDGQPFSAANDIIVSPTYVPDVVHASLDLMIDGESGIWHLSNGDALSWAQLAQRVATLAGRQSDRVSSDTAAALGMLNTAPRNSALGSERGRLMPPLEDALKRYMTDRLSVEPPPEECSLKQTSVRSHIV